MYRALCDVEEDPTRSQLSQMLSISESCVRAACTLAQQSLEDLIRIWGKANVAMNLDPQMKLFWEKSRFFLAELEKWAPGCSYKLGQRVTYQTNQFIVGVHETHKHKLVNSLNQERWVQCDVTSDRQKNILDRLTFGSSSTVEGDKEQTLHAAPSAATERSAAAVPTTTTSKSGKHELQSAWIDGRPYKAVWSALQLQENIIVYLDVCASYPLVAADLLNKILDLITLFDSRTRELVLEAQAIQLSKLRSISVKHLCVASQSIGLIIALMPYVSSHLSVQLPPRSRLLLGIYVVVY